MFVGRTFTLMQGLLAIVVAAAVSGSVTTAILIVSQESSGETGTEEHMDDADLGDEGTEEIEGIEEIEEAEETEEAEEIEEFEEPQEHEGEQPFCFREDGSKTHEREECDHDQGRHLVPEGPLPHAPEHARENFEEAMEHRFGPPQLPDEQRGPPPPHGEQRDQPPALSEEGVDIIAIVAEALRRLSDMRSAVQGTPAEQVVWDVIGWLSEILSRYGDAVLSPEEESRLAEEMHQRLSGIMEAQREFSSQEQYDRYEEHEEGDDGEEFAKEHMECMLGHMENMLVKLPQVIAIFDREGLPVSEEARKAAEEAQEKFREIASACRADHLACRELDSVFRILEEHMRPSMEKAIMENDRMDVMREIEDLMNEEESSCGMDGPRRSPDNGDGDGPEHGAPSQGGVRPMPRDGMMPPPRNDMRYEYEEDGEYRQYENFDGAYPPPEDWEKYLPPGMSPEEAKRMMEENR